MYRIRMMWLFTLIAGSLTLNACSRADVDPVESSTEISKKPKLALEDLGAAPELENDVWLNVDKPIRISELRGNVILLDFWTFGCINCQRVIPSLRGWHERYGEKGLVVIGVHYPEFSYEAEPGNLIDAIEKLEIPYAVAQDNQRQAWAAYGIRYWPTLLLIDKAGRVRYQHIGEGRYDEIEEVIRFLLAESFSKEY